MKNILTKKMNILISQVSKILAITVLALAIFSPVLVPVTAEASTLKNVACDLGIGYCNDKDTVVVEKKVYVTSPTVVATNYAISGYCYPNSSAANTNDVVTWSVYASGGNGSYSYSWSGTDGLSGNSQSVDKVYYSTGSKNASVTVYSSGASTKTIPCSSNIVIYNDNNNNNSDLSVSCSASDTSINTGDNVTWRANVSGGSGSYNYDWSGTDGLSGSNSSVSKTYYDYGDKYASVTVTSNNQTVSRDCNDSVYVDDNNNNNNSSLRVSCYPSDTSLSTDDRMTWYAIARGGNGNYDYDWSGTDNLNGSNSSVSKTYSYGGTKDASVTVYSGSRTVTQGCDDTVYVSDNYNNNYYYNNNSNLNVTCSANLTAGVSGNMVTWTAYPYGGNGYYTYAWSGTDSLTGYNSAIAKTYWLLGDKTATVTISSGNQTISRQCNNIVSISARPVSFATTDVTTGGDYPPAKTVTTVANTDLTVACSPNTDTAKLNDTVVWISNITGGTGKYVYQWAGSDNLLGDMNYLAKSYSSNGDKTAVLTVTSGNKTVTKICAPLTVGDTSQTASAFFGNMTGTFIIVLLLAIIAFLGVIMYFLNIRDREQMINNFPQQ
jgi:hypothetical protein